MAKAPVKKQSDLIDQIARLSIPAKVGIVVATIVAIGVAFYALFVMPYQEEKISFESQITKATSQIKTQKETLQKHKNIAKASVAVQSAHEYMQQYLPKEDEMPRLVQMVSDIASKAGLTDGITLFAPKLGVVRESYVEIPFTMNLEGEYLTILTFLYDFSQMERIINITQVDFTKPILFDKNKEIFHISVNCSGSTYRALTEEEAAAPKGRKR